MVRTVIKSKIHDHSFHVKGAVPRNAATWKRWMGKEPFGFLCFAFFAVLPFVVPATIYGHKMFGIDLMGIPTTDTKGQSLYTMVLPPRYGPRDGVLDLGNVYEIEYEDGTKRLVSDFNHPQTPYKL